MEQTKGFSGEMREHFKKLGKTEQEIAALENGLASKGQAARDAGLESKETTTPAPEAAAEPATEQPVYASAPEVASAIAELVQAMATLGTQLAAVQAEVKALKEADEVRIAKAAAAAPRASLYDLIAAQTNVIGNPAVAVDGRSTMAKAGPKQTPVDAAGYTNSPFLNGLMANGQGGAA